MENPRPEKAAVVEEVREKFSSADAAILTEYRGIDVRGMQQLRSALIEAGGDYKVYKNSLVRLAVADLDLDIDDLLLGPTAIAFIPPTDEGPGDAVPVAKALRDFARANEHLVVKGGLLGEARLTAEEARALAAVAPRAELLSRFAGGLAAPMQQLAGLLQALPRDLAGLLQALIDDRGGPEAAEAAPAEPEPEPEAEPEPEPEPEAAADASAESGNDEEEENEEDADAPVEAAEDAGNDNGNDQEEADSPVEAAADAGNDDGNDQEEADAPAEAAEDAGNDNGNEEEGE